MDSTEQIKFETLQLQFILTNLLKKREVLYLKGLNDEKINDKIRIIQTKIRSYANTNT